MKNQDIKRAIDTNLSGMKVTQKDMDAILRRIHEEENAPRRRKLPVAVLIAALLILLAGVAFATFTLMDYYEKAIQIEGEEQGKFINDWSLEHKLLLIDCMKDAGADVDEEKYNQLYNDELSEEVRDAAAMEILLEYYSSDDESDLLDTMDIIAKEKGDFQHWSLDDRAWLSKQMQLRPHQGSMTVHTTPEEEDISLEQAMNVAYDYYKAHYGLERQDFKETPLLVYFMYEEKEGTDGGREERFWSLCLELTIDHYNGQKLYDPSIYIDILANGNVRSASEPHVLTWEDEWYETMMVEDFWTIEGMYRFQETWRPKVAQLREAGIEIDSKDLLYLLDIEFGLPDDSDISRDDAYEIAYSAALAELTEDQLSMYGTVEAYVISQTGSHLFYIVFDAERGPIEKRSEALDQYLQGQIPFQIRVHIDARTGEVVKVFNNSSWTGTDRLGF